MGDSGCSSQRARRCSCSTSPGPSPSRSHLPFMPISASAAMEYRCRRSSLACAIPPLMSLICRLLAWARLPWARRLQASCAAATCSSLCGGLTGPRCRPRALDTFVILLCVGKIMWMDACICACFSSGLEPKDTTVRIKRGASVQDKHMTTGRINIGRGD